MKNAKIKFLILFILSFGHFNYSYGQEQKSYIIISFEDVYKKSQHGKKTYYWIIARDSVNTYDVKLSYLFFDFSKQNLEDCCNGVAVDPFLVFPGSKYEIDTQNSSELFKLKEIITRKKKKIMKVEKKWATGQKETIIVYATPVIGKFCSSNFHEIGQQRQGYKGKVYMPYSNFEYQEAFWNSAEAEYILNSDISSFNFDVISY
jgi:hypothetical protein